MLNAAEFLINLIRATTPSDHGPDSLEVLLASVRWGAGTRGQSRLCGGETRRASTRSAKGQRASTPS